LQILREALFDPWVDATWQLRSTLRRYTATYSSRSSFAGGGGWGRNSDGGGAAAGWTLLTRARNGDGAEHAGANGHGGGDARAQGDDDEGVHESTALLLRPQAGGPGKLGGLPHEG
jgi:hypothetical protein